MKLIFSKYQNKIKNKQAKKKSIGKSHSSAKNNRKNMCMKSNRYRMLCYGYVGFHLVTTWFNIRKLTDR